MPAYAIAHLRSFTLDEPMFSYMERIDATLTPFDGRFLAQGAIPSPLEGEWGGVVTLIEFPDRERAQGWYDSPAYQEIAPLRQGSSDTAGIIIDGVEPGHTSAGLAQSLRALMAD